MLIRSCPNRRDGDPLRSERRRAVTVFSPGRAGPGAVRAARPATVSHTPSISCQVLRGIH